MLASLSFADRVDVASIEKHLIDGPAFTSDSDPNVVDLAAAIDFDVVGLLYLLSLAASCRDTGRKIILRLPHDPHARQILRRMRFTAALEMVMRTPFRLLVDPADLDYFGEDPPPETSSSVDSSGGDTARASVLAYLVEQHHFGFSARRIGGEQSLIRMLDDEVGHWRSYAMVQLLRSAVYGQAVDVSRVVVQELVANVVEHPSPSMAVMASQLVLSATSERDVSPALTVAVWDDGTSIISTLRNCLQRTGNVRAWSPDSPDEFVVRRSDSSTHAVYYSDWTPNPSATDAELLLASLLPGVTRKAADRWPATTAAPVRRMDYGYGLFALYKAAVDHFRGSVELRCEQTTLMLTRPDASGPYQVDLRNREDLEPLTGTIVRVRLPVRDD